MSNPDPRALERLAVAAINLASNARPLRHPDDDPRATPTHAVVFCDDLDELQRVVRDVYDPSEGGTPCSTPTASETASPSAPDANSANAPSSSGDSPPA